MKRFAVALAVIAATSSAVAQEEGRTSTGLGIGSVPVVAAAVAREEARPSVGLGIGIVPIEVAGVTPTIELYVPLTVTPHFRFEPSLGAFTNNQRKGGTNSSVVTVGLGFFWVTRVAKPTDVYVGGRLKINFVSVETVTSNDSDNDFVIALAAGGEHYLSSNFSLGLEGQFGHYQNGKLSGARAVNDYGEFTTGLAFLRIYFE